MSLPKKKHKFLQKLGKIKKKLFLTFFLFHFWFIVKFLLPGSQILYKIQTNLLFLLFMNF